ncbi:histidine phosphatase family protein [Streptacidiphilus monticola]|uniref:phosphoglycerate mutase (2,3-diphosphoglycerate-dependent) n=1 Tax=Streptacidiphilus monticola TaxID=2161674 RepID=A0ABW1G285_9ACTN
MALTDPHPRPQPRPYPAAARRGAPRRLFPGLPGPAALTAVRHGQSTANAAFAAAEAAGALDVGITCRDADLRLTARGRAEAAALGRWLCGGRTPDSVWVSPYLRTVETAEIALAEVAAAGLPEPGVVVEERFRDRELGILEMLTSAAIELRHPEEAERRRRLGELRWRPPGGESLADVALRVRSALRDLYESEPDRRVLVVAHDATVLMLRHILDDLPEEELAGLPAVANTSVTHWSRPSPAAGLTLTAWNTLPHL